MKKIIIILVIIVSAISSTETFAQKKEMDSFQLQVDGLGCPFCAFGLEKKFKEFKGIKNVKIEIETGVFTFNYPTNKELSLEAVTKQVEKAGYTPISVTIKRANGIIEKDEVNKAVVTNKSNIAESSLFVAGNCGMCKARIEKAAKLEGVTWAVWDKDTKLLNLKFDKNLVSQKKIEQAISKAGHDTKNEKANNNTYNNLPGCCHYERIK